MPRPRIPDRRERILDAAERAILERGFDAVSVASIADDVGIAKGAIYREVAGKDALLDALLERGMQRMRQASAARLGDAPPSLAAAYRVGTEVLLGDALMTAAFLDDADVLGARLARVRDGRYRARMDAVAEWIRDLQASGRMTATIDPDDLALALSSTTLGLLSAARHLGPLGAERLHGALAAVEAMVARLEAADG